jgi:hypothetical protein
MVPLSNYDQTKIIVEVFQDFKFVVVPQQLISATEQISCVMVSDNSEIKVACSQTDTISVLRAKLVCSLLYKCNLY